MTFDAIDAWWWPYLFILIAGFAATDVWRFLGVYLGGRVSEDSELLGWCARSRRRWWRASSAT